MADLIGVFGGTFDPPHLGHLILAEEARSQLGLSRVLWVVSGTPPHKPDKPISDLEHRLSMVALAIEANPAFQISRADIDRPAPYFSHGTLSWLAERHPGAEFFFLMGGDSLRDLPTWNKPSYFIEQADKIVVMLRPHVEVDLTPLIDQFPALNAKLTFLKVPMLEISGEEIRERAHAGRSYRYFTTDDVLDYIESHRLYR
jgi:nicotinate-nucleotide adenylyltransferase